MSEKRIDRVRFLFPVVVVVVVVLTIVVIYLMIILFRLNLETRIQGVSRVTLHIKDLFFNT